MEPRMRASGQCSTIIVFALTCEYVVQEMPFLVADDQIRRTQKCGCQLGFCGNRMVLRYDKVISAMLYSRYSKPLVQGQHLSGSLSVTGMQCCRVGSW